MSTENKFLVELSERLALDKQTLKKAEEFFRVLQNKNSFNYVNDVAKGVLCLDLAATTLGIAFDREMGLKFSGLTKQMYPRRLNIAIQLLKLERPNSISMLCVQNGCTEVKDIAEEILHKYKNANKHIENLDHPQYNAVAVYTACKIKRIKVIRKPFLDASLLSVIQFNKLGSQFEILDKNGDEIVDEQDMKKRKPRISKKREVKEEITNIKDEPLSPKKKCTAEEDYEVWRRKILEEAIKGVEMEADYDFKLIET